VLRDAPAEELRASVARADRSTPLPPAAPRPTREELIAVGLPIVRRVAFRLARRLPPNVDVGDLIGAGSEGMLKAIDAWDASRAPSFEAYLDARVRGAILDELRASDVMTRHGRRRLSETARAVRKLEQRLGRSPEEDEIAAELGLSLEDYQKLAEDLARGPALGRLGEDPDGLRAGTPGPVDDVLGTEQRRRLLAALGKLPVRQQQVLALYYQEECTQLEIGKILGVTESRVCQILGDATVRLRALMEE
jgi:RNA polymerase sigma factor for flagellar operon FliA